MLTISQVTKAFGGRTLFEDASLQVPMTMHHIHMSTPDMEKLRGWYVKTFGARPGTRGNFLSAIFNGGQVDF